MGVTQEKVTADTAACVRGCQIGCIGVDVQHHGARHKTDFRIRVRGQVVQEVYGRFALFLRRSFLFGRDVIESMEDSWVHGAAII